MKKTPRRRRLALLGTIGAVLFTVGVAHAYDPPELSIPIGATSNPVEFKTAGDEGTTWQAIWIYDRATGAGFYDSYYHDPSFCDGTTCTYTYGSLAAGNYLWSARSWGPDEQYSDWTASPYRAFSVDMPGAIDISPAYAVSPNGTVGQWSNGGIANNQTHQFRWRPDANATTYDIYVVDANGTTTVIDDIRVNQSPSPAAACGTSGGPSALCSYFDSGLVFPVGPLYYWVRGGNNGAKGPWSETFARFWLGESSDPTPCCTPYTGPVIEPHTGTGAQRINLGANVTGRASEVKLSEWDVPYFSGNIGPTFISVDSSRGGAGLASQYFAPGEDKTMIVGGIDAASSVWVRYWFVARGAWWYYDFQYLNN